MRASIVVIVTILPAILLAACAGTPGEGAEAGLQECRTLKITGSKIAKRDCRTLAEWQRYDEEEAARSEAAGAASKQNIDPNTF